MNPHDRKLTSYVVADWLSTSVAVLLFNMVRYALLPGAKIYYSLTDFLGSPMVIAGQILFPLGMLVVYYMSGYYSNLFAKSRVVEFTTTVATALVGTLVIIFVALINDLTNDRAQDYRVFLAVFGLLFMLVYLPRAIITSLTKKSISKGKISFPTAIVGRGRFPEAFSEFSASRMPHLGFLPAMRIYSDNIRPEGDDSRGICIDNMVNAVNACGISRFIVLPDPDGWEASLETINRLYAFQCPIFVDARRLPPYLLNQRLVSFTADPLIDVSHAHLPPSTLCTKRALDFAIGLSMMVLTAIPVALLAIAVKIDSPGPAFFRQKRVGLHRRPFTIFKLRTMVADAEADGKPRLSSPGDSRITPLGKFLRKYRLDELPQFLNVVRGDMSLVGPRPERPEFVEQIEKRAPSHALLHRMRPGITSLAMVKYGYASTVDQMIERMKFDLIYLQNISLLSDIKILLYTFRTVFSGKGI
ncbi:MAG: sugar transferase [Paramuribaculum sp.]|nr:sugar transferase [Paramuribaculum sp.]